MNLGEYASYDALGLAELVKTKQVSPRELAQAAMRAIEIVNPDVMAVVETYPDTIESLDESTLGNGPFRGAPFLIKDVGAHFKGRKTENGSRLCRGLVVEADDYYAEMLRDSGVNLVGRSNTPEFSMALCAENLLFGSTSNPWKKGCSTSGSTGGGAAAVASGMVPIAHGSDMGGSIRGPAAWCGTIGLYPSRGRVSVGPDEDEGGFGMTQSFVMTKSMRDTATMLDCLSVPQPGDPYVIARPPEPFAAYLTKPAAKLRVACYAKPLMDAPVDPEVAAAVRATADVLSRLGHDVEEVTPPIDLARIDAACKVVWYYGFDEWLDSLGRKSGREVGPDTVERATLMFYEFAKRLSAAQLFAALEEFNRIRRAIGRFFRRYDVLVTPTCAQVAAPFGVYGMNVEVPPDEFLVHEQRPCQFMIAYNVAGQPAMSLPLGQHSNGLPIGVQLGARHSEEHLLVQLGVALEQAMPWRDRVPSLHVARLARA
jgi:amidase